MDPALFFKNNEKGKLIRLICAYVDDYIHCGTEEFRKNVIKPERPNGQVQDCANCVKRSQQDRTGSS